ncbi:predicted protein [Lichtheimia corymbifera JMRC:FSU:9682]|uniref:F-box domain-containing protein n=1 Tax=Lichtheimia corymbifera JMRC:FSU:9682 TaxID=1263082 RepID=A0A068RKK8_9FUNG|nr:predicted protein [Lichtheimia corymbifera JMRC:FSU:9682]
MPYFKSKRFQCVRLQQTLVLNLESCSLSPTGLRGDIGLFTIYGSHPCLSSTFFACRMDALPPELIDSVLEHLSQAQRAQASAVSRRWHSVINPRLYHAPDITTLKQLDQLVGNDLSSCRSLISILDLSKVREHVTDKHIAAFSQYPLYSLNLSKCHHISASALNQLLQTSIQTLQTALLNHCRLDTESLELLRQANLIRLDLSGTMLLPCHAIDTPHHLETLMDPARSQLRVLHVAGCNWVDSITVTNIAQGFPRLTHLSLFWCDQIKVASCLETLLLRLPDLRYLDLQHVPAIPDAQQDQQQQEWKEIDLHELIRSHPHLQCIEYTHRRRKATIKRKDA